MAITLRPYQDSLVNSIRASFGEGFRAPLAVSATGSGKTVTFSYICDNAAARGNETLVMVHRQELLMQTSRTLTSFGVRHGLIAAGMTSSYQTAVQVASVDTIIRRADKMHWRPKLIICDEGHHFLPGNKWGKVYEAMGQPLMLGVTATPIRGDGKGLGVIAGGYYDDMILGPTTRDLIDDGYLSDYTIYGSSRHVDLAGVLVNRTGDYNAQQLEDRLDKPTITGDAVEHYASVCPGQPAVVFCVSIKHAQHVAEQFCAAGFRFRCIDGTMKDSERKAAIDDLASGKLHGLTSCEIISEGTDIPVIAVAILLRPTQSLALHLQQIGRALRPIYAPGYDLSTREGRLVAQAAGIKPRAVILDHVGNVMKLGLPDEDFQWSLEGEKKKRRGAQDPDEVKARQCPACFSVHKIAPACPDCGHLYTGAGAREIEQVAGQLVKLDKAAIEAARKQAQREVYAARTLEQLKEIEKQRDYKPGWAEQVFRSRKRKSAAAW